MKIKTAPHKKDLEKPVTLGVLLEYTDEFLIPKIGEMIDDKLDGALGASEHRMKSYLDGKLKEEIGASEHRMKSYIDDKLADHTAELFKRLDKKYAREQEFKTKVVELLRKHNIGSPEELAYLKGLAERI